MTRPARFRLVGVAVLLSLSGCASWPRVERAVPCRLDRKPIVRRQPIWWHLFDVTILEPLEQPLHVLRFGRKLFGIPIRARNLEGDRLTGSAFWTDRDPAQLSPEEVRWGPTRPDSLPQPPFTITKPKTEGKTAGFFATDAQGRRYLLKLDPVAAPELLSGAEVVTSKLLYALGYHVPSYEIVELRAAELRVGPGVTVADARGGRRPFTEAELQSFVTPRLRDGRLRVAASRILDGEILGPAKLKRFQDCAEVRALQVAYAWLNNIDAKDHNSLLVWNGTDTVGYLIDFGTSLGADAGVGGPKGPCAGWRNVVDLEELSLELMTATLHRSVCHPEEHPVSPAVGVLPPHVHPGRWKPYAPNVAFNAMTDNDARWIALRMARFSRAQIEAAVAAGRYSQAADAAYLVEALEQRRLGILHHYADVDVEESPR